MRLPPLTLPRGPLLLLVAVATLLALGVKDERTSSFCAGLAVGAGAGFLLSWLKRRIHSDSE